MRRITRDVALNLSNLRRFFVAEKAARGPTMLNLPTRRVLRAEGVSRSTETCVGQKGWADARPASGDPERRASKRRIPVEELSRVRAAVYEQYKNRAISTLDSTLAYLEVQAAVSSWSGPPSDYKWTRATLHRGMHDLGFNFKAGPNHYDVAREKRTVIAPRESFIEKLRVYRESGRTIYYSDETWANKNMTPRRTWADGGLQAQLDVPSGKGAWIIIAHVGSRETGLVAEAGLVFVGKKKAGDYHGEMNSDLWLKWLEQTVLPKIRGGVLVVDRAPYHMKLTAETRLVSSKIRKADLADWLESYDAVPDYWPTT